MPRSKLYGCLPLTLILIGCISLRAQTGNPFFSVINYGARCDG
jgi:hypothetical protein